jgi:hypothetical protein
LRRARALAVRADFADFASRLKSVSAGRRGSTLQYSSSWRWRVAFQSWRSTVAHRLEDGTLSWSAWGIGKSAAHSGVQVQLS